MTDFVAFEGPSRVAAGTLLDVAMAVRQVLDRDPRAAIHVFDRETAAVVDLDLRGGEQDLVTRQAPVEASPGRGRPRLGVVAREVTLLPRHWDWLARQPGGASVTLRRLVENARKSGESAERERVAAAYRFMLVMAGDRAGFEEATRALFAGDRPGLEARAASWPPDIGDEILRFLDGPPPP